ncbi:MAG TPA: methyltransferase domain-containing protein [Polyangiaceae bacterium]|nr:methyltransferase domain-containing protein [Polyangiaceae bacterium]
MAATCPLDFDVARLREGVRDVYGRVAEDPTGDFHFHRGLDYAVELLGYSRTELSRLPSVATSRFAGVGNPFAAGAVLPGDVVLDHACGAGTDLLLAAGRVGARGRAIGVDMTPAMLQQARAAVVMAQLTSRVELKAGLFEELPLEDASVDVVISNGVLNLSPDKTRTLAEVVRVLRPNGRLLLADVVVQRELTLAARSSPDLWAACVGGALPEGELLELAHAAGLRDGRIAARFDCYAGTSAMAKVSSDLRLAAVSFFARKPA